MYNTQKHKRKTKKALVTAYGNKCQICGLEENPAFFEFHHLDPNTKSFSLSESNLTHSKDKIITEAKKCIMVCPNCHRKIELGFIKTNKKPNFDEIIFNKTLNKDKNDNRCITCGKPIPKGNKQCADCWNETKYKVNRKPAKNELKKLIETTPFTSIGKTFGVSDNAIRKWCKKYNLPTTKQEIHKLQSQTNIP